MAPVATPLSLDDQDESVRIAVRALGDMRNRSTTTQQNTSGPSASSSPTSPSITSPASPPRIVHRVSAHPLFNSALRVYETSKNSSRVVKYGAEMMESSMRTISRPVMDRLPVDVNTIDEFAGRQLDRFERYRRPSHSRSRSRSRVEDDQANPAKPARQPASELLETNSSALAVDSRSHTPTQQSISSEQPSSSTDLAVTQRSRWQTVLTEAGGLSAAFSDESMRHLKYCLQMLQYATQHIDNQIIILRDCMAGLQARAAGEPSASELRVLTDVRRDVVHTVRQVVDVVSKYAGGALPEPARARVKSFILHLPQRWAAATAQDPAAAGAGASAASSASTSSTGSQKPLSSRRRRHRERGADGVGGSGGGSGNGHVSATSSPTISRSSSPRPGPYAHPAPPATAGSAAQAAVRVLTLATESLDMMRGVTGVVKESLDRADAWVERLRVVGLQRGSSSSSSSMAEEGEEEGFDRDIEASMRVRMPKEEFDADALSPVPLSMSVEGVTPVSSVPSTPVVALTPLDAPVRELSLKGPEEMQQVVDDDNDDAKTYAPAHARHGRMDVDE